MAQKPFEEAVTQKFVPVVEKLNSPLHIMGVCVDNEETSKMNGWDE